MESRPYHSDRTLSACLIGLVTVLVPDLRRHGLPVPHPHVVYVDVVKPLSGWHVYGGARGQEAHAGRTWSRGRFSGAISRWESPGVRSQATSGDNDNKTRVHVWDARTHGKVFDVRESHRHHTLG